MNVTALDVVHVPAMLRAGVSDAVGVAGGVELLVVDGLLGDEQAGRLPTTTARMRITTHRLTPVITGPLAPCCFARFPAECRRCEGEQQLRCQRTF